MVEAKLKHIQNINIFIVVTSYICVQQCLIQFMSYVSPHDWVVDLVQVCRVVNTRSEVGQVARAIMAGCAGLKCGKLAAICCR